MVALPPATPEQSTSNSSGSLVVNADESTPAPLATPACKSNINPPSCERRLRLVATQSSNPRVVCKSSCTIQELTMTCCDSKFAVFCTDSLMDSCIEQIDWPPGKVICTRTTCRHTLSPPQTLQLSSTSEPPHTPAQSITHILSGATQVPHLSTTKLPPTMPVQSVHVELSPEHKPQASIVWLPPQVPVQSKEHCVPIKVHVPHRSNNAFPLATPEQSAQVALFPPHTPQSSSFKFPPQTPLQSGTQSLF